MNARTSLALLAFLALAALLGGLTWMRARTAAAQRATLDAPQDPPAPSAPLPVQRAPWPEPAAPAAPAEHPHNAWVQRNDAALALLEAGELERAVDELEACCAALPEHTVIRANLAEALARLARARHERGERAQALLALERALLLAPQRAELADLLERWRAEELAERGFASDRSTHFELAYDGDRSELLAAGPALLERLEQAYLDLAERLRVDPAGPGRQPLRVVLYRREEFARVTGLRDWVAGAFDGSLRAPIDELAGAAPALQRVLRHELAHAFVRELGGRAVPGWLNEGVAQWLEGPQPAPRSLARAQRPEWIALEELVGSLAGWQEQERIRLAYDQSLALVLEIERELGAELLRELIAACAAEGLESVFERRVRLTLAQWIEQRREG